MGQNTFQSILSSLQVFDKNLDLPRNHPAHDPLFKVRPMIEMMDRTFVKSYKFGRDLSFDKALLLIQRYSVFLLLQPI